MVEAPCDELTGVPLLIKPDDEVPELMVREGRLNTAIRRRNQNYNSQLRQLMLEGVEDPRQALEAVGVLAPTRDFASVHHAHYPDQAMSVAEESARAMRECLGQLVMQRDHVAHHRAYTGPWLPQTESERFMRVLFCAARYIPRIALDFSSGSPEQVSLSDAEIWRLQTMGEVRIVKDKPVRQFIHNYVLANPETDAIPKKLADKFISLGREGLPDNTTDLQDYQTMSYHLLARIIRTKTEPFREVYRESRKEGLWSQHSPDDVIANQLLGTNKYQRQSTIQKIGGRICTTLLEQLGELAAA